MNKKRAAGEDGENGNRVTDPHTIGNPQNTRKTGTSGARVTEGDQKSRIFGSTPRAGESVGNTVTIGNSVTQGAASGVDRLTDEQAERVKRLIGEGMSPVWARAEVLGGGAGL